MRKQKKKKKKKKKKKLAIKMKNHNQNFLMKKLMVILKNLMNWKRMKLKPVKVKKRMVIQII